MYKGANFINGSFCHERNDFPSLDPCTEKPIGHFPQSTEEEVKAAVSTARMALKEWRAVSRIHRAEHFDRLCQVLKARIVDVAKAISKETGKNLNESHAEAVEALHMAQYCFGKGREPCGEVVASEIADRDSYVLRKPKGVVAVVAPWNFPFAIGGFWCAGPALLEGNTVVFKPSELTPMVGQITAELFEEAGFPPGVFNVIHGDGAVGEHLVRGYVDHVCFTGSAEVGQIIRKACADSWHKTCSCEMGSKSAVMVFDDCDIDLAVSACLNSAFKLSGQRCVSASRLLVQRGILPKFRDRFVSQVKKAIACDPFSTPKEASITFGPLISEEQLKRVDEFNCAVRADKTCEVLVDGGNPIRPGYFLKPLVYQTEWGNKPFLKQEVFGPHVAIIPFTGLHDAINIYNDTDYGLALGVITSDFKKAREVRNHCDFGLGYWNSGSIAAESHLPFGGVKKSGNGFPSAAGMFDAVVHKVSWSVNHGSLSFPQGLK